MTAAAFLWGFGEATLFFVVPDLVIGWVVLSRGLRPGLRAALAAAAGAMLGAPVMLLWAAHDPEGARAALLALPAIDAPMVGGLHDRMAMLGTVPALFLASLTGVPFKIGAVLMPGFGWEWWQAVLWTPLLRLPRFLGVALLCAALRRVPLPPRWLSAGYAVFWIVFYAWYWGAAGSGGS